MFQHSSGEEGGGGRETHTENHETSCKLHKRKEREKGDCGWFRSECRVGSNRKETGRKKREEKKKKSLKH